MHTLACICEYRKESIPATSITPCNYVSTESMLPNKAGVAPAASMPLTGNASLYEKGDVLISNIRPYFKKIWLADRGGSCSNDVLVIKPTHCDSDYLYWVLSSDRFFRYMTATAKGTKMPRGDKDSIMRFPLQIMSERDRLALSSILNPIKRKIALNNRINDYLIELAHARFEHALEESSTEVLFDDIAVLEDSKRIPLNSRDRAQRKGPYPYYGATAIMDYVDDYLFDGIRVLLGEDGTVINADGKPILQYVWGKFWVNNHAHIIEASSKYSIEAIYIALSKTAINHIVTGAVQMKISQKNLKGLRLSMPDPNAIFDLDVLFEAYRHNVDENIGLKALRDTLLPKLMSGEVDVSRVELVPDLH